MKHFLPLAGFTLIEISIVVLILGMVLTLALPRLGGTYSQLKCEEEIGKIAALVEYLYNQAQIKNEGFSLVLNLDKKEYWVESEGINEENEEDEEESNIFKRKWASFLDIQDILISNCKTTQGEVVIKFHSTGYVDPATFHFSNNQEGNYTLFLNPLTGKTKLEKGYLQEEPI